MFTVEKSFHFEAAHSLTFHNGKCKGLHGHSYILTVQAASKTLQDSGPQKNMVWDFDEISQVAKPMIKQYFDHHYLNDTLDNDSPTAEFIAKWIYDYLKPQIPLLTAIYIQETVNCKVTYRPSH